MDKNSRLIGNRLQNGALTSEQVGAYNIYKGARYVPKIMGQWDANVNYEPLSIVINQGNSYTSAQYVPAGITLQDNGPYWFLTGNFNGQIVDIENQLTELEKDVEATIKTISNFQLEQGQNIITTLLAERQFHHGDERKDMQGCCYVENGVYVFCSALNEGCSITAINISTYSELWSVVIPTGGHGNSITFNPNNRKLYIACLTPNQVVTVNYDNPGFGVVDTYTLTTGNNCYSIALNEENNIWYVIHYIGNVQGEFNRLYMYNIDFSQALGYVDLKIVSPIAGGQSWQGLHVIHNNVGYVPIYYPNAMIQAFDITTGQLIGSWTPTICNGYKSIWEMQSIMYNKQDDMIDFAFTSHSDSNGNDYAICIGRTNILGNVIVYNPWNQLYESGKEELIYKVDYNDASYTPGWSIRKLKSLADGINASRIYQGEAINITLEPYEKPIYHPYITNFRGSINCNGNTIESPRFLFSDCRIYNGTIIGSTTVDNIKCQTVCKHSNVLIDMNINAPEENYYIVYAHWYSQVKLITPSDISNLLTGICFNGSTLETPNKNRADGLNSGIIAPVNSRAVQNVNLYSGTLTLTEAQGKIVPQYAAYNAIYIEINFSNSVVIPRASSQGVSTSVKVGTIQQLNNMQRFIALDLYINYNTGIVKLNNMSYIDINSSGEITYTNIESFNLKLALTNI